MATLTVILSWIILFITAAYFYIRNKYNYWAKRKVPHVKPTFLLGNYGRWILQKEYVGTVVEKLYNELPKEPVIGAYLGAKPVLLVKDPEIIKLVTTKDFSHFTSRELMDHAHKETFGRGLIGDFGESWKFTRTNMAPMFTSAKLRNMFPLIEECAVDFEKYLDKDILGKPVEVRQLITTYTMASFVSCAFGIDLKNFGEANVFQNMGTLLFEVDSFRSIMLFLRIFFPNIFYAMGLRQFSKDLSTFFNKLLKEVFESRNYKPSARKDFVDAFLNLKETAKTENKLDKIDDEYIVAQTLAIFTGGFETSASTVSFLLYELAKNKEIQAKVHTEIDGYLEKTGGKITYDCLTELPFLSACMDETMRLYPIAGVLTREVTKNYTLPSGVTLEKGLTIHFPVYALHHDPEYFPEPEEFRPERFYGETKEHIVPYTYLPFGEGPRICIGKRFAKLQSTPGVITILRNHRAELAEGMPTKIQFEPKSITTQSKGGIRLKFLHRN